MWRSTTRTWLLGVLAWSAAAAGASTGAGSAGPAGADPGELDLTFGALAFGDVYYVPRYHDPEDVDAAGAVLRRGYLTFDASAGSWFSRLRFEANQSGEFEDYDLEVDVKDLYLGRDMAGHRLVLGFSPTPTFDVIEALWGARYLARTPTDLQGLSSRDVGVSVKGPLSADGRLSYRAMFGLGTDFGVDSTEGDKLMAALNWRLRENWMVDLYADYENPPDTAERRTLQVFLGFDAQDLRLGLQYTDQDRKEEPPLELISAFLVTPWSAAADLILRVDRLLEPSPRGDDIAYLPFDPSATATMFIAGLEFEPAPWFTVTPNVVIKSYGKDDAGEHPATDVQLRLTLFLNLE